MKIAFNWLPWRTLSHIWNHLICFCHIKLAFPNAHDTCQTLTLQHGGTGHFHLVPLFFLRRAGQVAANAHRADKVSDTMCIITRTPCAYYFRHGRHVWVSTIWDFGGERVQKAHPSGTARYLKRQFDIKSRFAGHHPKHIFILSNSRLYCASFSKIFNFWLKLSSIFVHIHPFFYLCAEKNWVFFLNLDAMCMYCIDWWHGLMGVWGAWWCRWIWIYD